MVSFKILIAITIILFSLSCTKLEDNKIVNNSSKTSKIKKSKRYQEAFELFENKKIEKAYKEFFELLKEYPDDWKLNYHIGMIAAKGYQIKTAEHYLKIAIKLSPERWESYRELASLYKSLYRYKDALIEIKKVFKYNNDDALSNFTLAFLSVKLKDKTIDPIKYYKQAIKSAPKYMLAYIHFGQYYLSLKEFDKAEEIWIKALKQRDSITIRRMLASLSIRKKDYNEAIKRYKKLIKEKPNYVEGYLKYGNALEKLNRKKEAEKIYKEAIDIKESYIYTSQALAELYLKEKRYKEAIEVYENLLTKSISNKEYFLFKQAEIFKEIKDLKKFNTIIKKLKKIDTKLANNYIKYLK